MRMTRTEPMIRAENRKACRQVVMRRHPVRRQCRQRPSQKECRRDMESRNHRQGNRRGHRQQWTRLQKHRSTDRRRAESFAQGQKQVGPVRRLCFRFATVGEIEDLLREGDIDTATARDVVETVPVTSFLPHLAEQADYVMSYVRRGYESNIVLPLRTVEAIELENARSSSSPTSTCPSAWTSQCCSSARVPSS